MAGVGGHPGKDGVVLEERLATTKGALQKVNAAGVYLEETSFSFWNFYVKFPH